MKIFKTLVLVCIALYSIVYLLASASLHINPSRFWPFTYLSLTFPAILVGMLCCSLATLIFFRKYFWVTFIVICCGYKSILNTTGFHIKKAFKQEKAEGCIRVLSWNVDDFIDSDKKNDTTGNLRRKILSFIKKSDADVLCLQDFRSCETKPWIYSNVSNIKDSLAYPYCYFSWEEGMSDPVNDCHYGTAIFSRFPMIDSGAVKYNIEGIDESLVHTNIVVNKDTITIFSTHLLSMGLGFSVPKIVRKGDFLSDNKNVMLNKDKVKTLHYFDVKHAQQALFVKDRLTQSQYPFIFCADLNAVPSSFVYNTISKGLNDPFLQKGFGWGGTYDAISPTLRIDVTLTSKNLRATQYFSPKLYASDHFPVVSDIRLH
jgi:endonuclease/exonuclease/phosphatase family metal-dependent hydrolase